MTIGSDDLTKIAHLARLQLDQNHLAKLGGDLANILKLFDQLQTVDTREVEPMAHPMDAVQILRADQVTESNQRELFQSIAPATEDGLYLVPKVIE